MVLEPYRDERRFIAAAPAAIDRSDAPLIARLHVRAIEKSSRARDQREDGVAEALTEPLRLQVPGAAHDLVAPVVIGRIAVDGASAVRLRFDRAPVGTRLFLAGSDDDQFVAFDPSAAATWGPTTLGSEVTIAAHSSGGEVLIGAAANLSQVSLDSTACLRDVACTDDSQFDDLDEAARAIGYVRFVRDGKTLTCSGGLVADAKKSGTPYFLTARHCISTAAEASSMEVVWDLRSTFCGSNRMAEVSRSFGAEMVVSSEATDITLLRLHSVPSGRVYLGLDLRPLQPGTTIHRIAHAGGLSQTYSSTVVDPAAASCVGAPRGRYLYSRLKIGAIAPGASGAPSLIPGPYAVGQLLGLCGAAPGDSCATFNAVVDGSLRESWPLLAPFLGDPVKPARRRAAR